MLFGTWRYAGGISGTVALPPGSTVKQIVMHSQSNGTFQMFGGATIALPSNDVVTLRFDHEMVTAGSTPGHDRTLVFGNTSFYFVETIGPGLTSS